MKVMHIESGLGNQMLDYADLLATKYANPTHDFYIETIIYELNDVQNVINMWNGYELERVFGLKIPNVKSLFAEDQWNRIIQSVKDSQFWNNNWQFAPAICEAFSNEGLVLSTTCTRKPRSKMNILLDDFSKSFIGYQVKRAKRRVTVNRENYPGNLFRVSEENELTGHTLRFCYRNSGIEKIDKEIRESFVFPKITDDYNKEIKKILNSTQSVAVHARRGDMLSQNGQYYKYGYFKRAIHYIKKEISEPLFVFFCDEGSMDWVKTNLHVFGLNREDKLLFVTENKGNNSFRDMQLISECKHAVITNSSFGYWGAYLNNYEKKITCSPDDRINTTHHF